MMTEAVHSVFDTASIGAALDVCRHSWIGDRADLDCTGSIAHINPSNGDSLGDIDEAGPVLVDRAVAAARTAFQRQWGRLAARKRKQLLRDYAQIVTDHREELAALETLEVGRPIAEALTVLARGPELLSECVELIDGAQGDLAGADDRRMSVSWHRPRGVVAAITPWNFPCVNVLMRLAPALAAGNTVVVKPSEYSPRSAVRLAQLALEAGLPEGVVNVVTGSGRVTGHALAEHADIDLISFTGSTRTARDVLMAAAEHSLKPVLLECGGKSPQILLDDIFDDPGIWAPIFFSAFWNSGQWCVARTRLLVPRSRIAMAIDGLKKAAATWRLGDPRYTDTRLGPLASPQQFRRVNEYLEIAGRCGQLIELPCPRGATHPDGCYVAPRVIVAEEPSGRIVQEEVFGPILTIQPYEDEEQALKLANGTSFGLAASVWTNVANTGYKLARHVQAGLVEVITSSAVVGEAMPRRHYEPSKQSGFGVDGGKAGLLRYTHAQSVTFRF
jgi:acyl-CoA reductase-like NAD-dependent aldehyde dehydrogenase